MDVEVKTKRLLVVDDDLIARFGLRHILENAGFHVEEAENGSIAIKKFADSPSGYDAVLVDYNMPGMDGAEVTKELRKIGKTSEKVLIIGITAHIDPKVKAICMKAGMDTMLSKPIDVDKLNKLLKNSNN